MRTALFLVDVQRNMLEGDGAAPDAPRLRPVLDDLLRRARLTGAVVVHVQNDGGPGDPDEPGCEGWELALAPAPGELVVRKDRCDTFAGNPDLADILAERGVEQIVVAGFQSEYCVEETSRGAQRTGVPVLLVRGGHGTYDGDEPAATISAAVEQRLAADGIRLVDPDVLRAP